MGWQSFGRAGVRARDHERPAGCCPTENCPRAARRTGRTHRILALESERGREAAHDNARTMPVHIVRLDSVRTGALQRAYPLRNGLKPLDGLPYRFYSPTSDEVQISANATLNYIFK